VPVERDVELLHHLGQPHAEIADHALGRTLGVAEPGIFLPALALEPQLVVVAAAHRRRPIGADDLGFAGPERRIDFDKPLQIFADGHGFDSFSQNLPD
jgi:hypothetical protein